ncbi:MAG: hypothetical protein ACYCWW_18445 [Deltaproteobacteria bacterium]
MLPDAVGDFERTTLDSNTNAEAIDRAMYPSARKAELFARRRRLGWDAWDDEVA